ncbi:MAG: cysteine desulfurase [Bacteroidetes bacterium]|nr:cysteine desulfurase [Rhodothermia bacterium]MCS7154609.1 cysteine desulfurase [Bacteroidota bacterium]MCX7906326.1 cysteine desulfurase [Bacteroidota bacterium]MDW8137402.1 cysteine desulfurase family protein [Bacteroidota bacterium]MDW8285644.1 cysteine desulfurase family protein [Bacteroidota bacterium]
MASRSASAIYLDYAATTPLDPRARRAMMPYLGPEYGNPSSIHQAGRRVRATLEEARERIAALIGAQPGELIFTSGGTEAINMALWGLVLATGRRHIVTTAVEHHAVLHVLPALRHLGVRATVLPVDAWGRVDPDQVRAALEPDTALVSVIHANNELGTLNPVAEIARACRERGVWVHVDAVQSMGKFRFRVDELGVDLLSASAHKFYGPKGVGFLYVRSGTPFEPLVRGGSQERNRRGGTENVAGLVGMARALELAWQEASRYWAHAERLRALLLAELSAVLGSAVRINSPEQDRLPHILNISFPPRAGRALDGELLLFNLDLEGLCVSNGAACSSGAFEPSHVLRAIGLDEPTARASVRISTGKPTRPEEVQEAVCRLTRVLRRMGWPLEAATVR